MMSRESLLSTIAESAAPAINNLRALATSYTYVFRGSPLIIVLYLFTFGVPGLRLRGTPPVLVLGGAALVIVYGERPVAAAVSAAGDTVVVAYEDPNRRTPQVMLAISYTAGHLFETRVSASGDDVDARAPDVRLLKGGRVVVG